MRNQSSKRARLMRKCTPERRAFLEQFPWCWACGAAQQMSVHEMARGGSREVALDKRITWFAACGYCNCGELNDEKIWPIERQLAVKKLLDPDYFDLTQFNTLRRVDPYAVTLHDLRNFVRRERKRLNV